MLSEAVITRIYLVGIKRNRAISVVAQRKVNYYHILKLEGLIYKTDIR